MSGHLLNPGDRVRTEDGRVGEVFGTHVYETTGQSWASVRLQNGHYYSGEQHNLTRCERVVVLIDANDGEVLEAPDGVEVEFIPWDKIANDPEMPEDAVQDLDDAIAANDLTKALRITHALTAEPDDEGEDPRALGLYP